MEVVDLGEVNISFSESNYAQSYEIYSSTDAQNYSLEQEVTENSVILTNLEDTQPYYFKVRAKNSTGVSSFTEVLGSIPKVSSKILIVNGFDRIQNTNNTFDFIKYHSSPLLQNGYGYSSSSNEAVFNGIVDLKDYSAVFWILLDESTSDETFNQLEQEKVEEYLQYGGNLFVSGSEIGWDLDEKGSESDRDFYNYYLMADYVSDAPKNQSGTYYRVESLPGELFEGVGEFEFDNGSHGSIDVDWPDAINAMGPAVNTLKYSDVSTSSGVAGISYIGTFGPSFFIGKIVHLSFPYESVYEENDRIGIMEKVLEFFDLPVSVENDLQVINNFSLEQNYPNPFNPATKIQYTIPVSALGMPAGESDFMQLPVSLKVFDILGREVATLVNEQQSPGKYEVVFDVLERGLNLSSGTYVYVLRYGDLIQSKKMLLIK